MTTNQDYSNPNDQNIDIPPISSLMVEKQSRVPSRNQTWINMAILNINV